MEYMLMERGEEENQKRGGDIIKWGCMLKGCGRLSSVEVEDEN